MIEKGLCRREQRRVLLSHSWAADVEMILHQLLLSLSCTH